MNGIPAQIGRYRVVNRIGRGGMGALYLAWDPTLERQVAIKILIDDNDELRERFSREARSAAASITPTSSRCATSAKTRGGRSWRWSTPGPTRGHHPQERATDDRRKLQLAEALVDGLAFAHKAGSSIETSSRPTSWSTSPAR
jgi:serine/threonine protein kinase